MDLRAREAEVGARARAYAAGLSLLRGKQFSNAKHSLASAAMAVTACPTLLLALAKVRVTGCIDTCGMGHSDCC